MVRACSGAIFRPDPEENVHLLLTSKPYGISGIEKFFYKVSFKIGYECLIYKLTKIEDIHT